MPAITKKREVDKILDILTKFGRTDDSRFDETWIGNMYDQIRSQLIVAEYQQTGIVDRNWLTDLGLTTFYPVNFADDESVNYCCSDMSKTTLPNLIPLGKDGFDLGLFSLISACGTKEYYFQPMSSWKMIPKEHVRSRFSYYDRINTALYVNKKIEKLRPIVVLASPEDGYIVNSAPITSGNLVNGTVYRVKYGQIFYSGATQLEDSTFTAGATTTFTGTGKVYLASQLQTLSETQPYPVSSDMARQIALEMLTKEFKIEDSALADAFNDSADDSQK